ncbi:MAG: glycoside hydrolase family 36 protein [Acidobacteriota bacterium]
MRLLAGMTVAVILLATADGVQAQTAPPVSENRAFVETRSGDRSWVIGNGLVALTVGIDRLGQMEVTGLTNPASGHDWVRQAAAGVKPAPRVPQTSILAGLRYTRSTTASFDGGVRLDLVFDDEARGLRLTRQLRVYAGVPVVESSSVLEDVGARAVDVPALETWSMTASPGTLTWIAGFTPRDAAREPFSVVREEIGGVPITIESSGRSSGEALPWFCLESGAERLVGGLLWSGPWTLQLTPGASGVQLSVGASRMATALEPGSRLETPRGIIGVASTDGRSAADTIRQYVELVLRGGQALRPLVTYNTWFVYGADIDEAAMRTEIDRAARVGAEVFVVDAGWYLGAGAGGRWDFASGLGNLTADPEKFPSGLRALADYAHARRLLFGIWVEPERISLEVSARLGIPASWLATEAGRYDPGQPASNQTHAQVCLGAQAARDWLVGRLSELLDKTQADYLKWDNNIWVTCTRTDHGHGAANGPFVHVQGLYDVLSRLRARYPNLLIENCSGGGNRLDLGMLAYTDVAWMDDRTSPSIRVRHNLEGLSAALPASYLLSFVMGEDGEFDPALWVRSRMPGVLGLGDGSTAALEEVTAGISDYKKLRDFLLSPATYLLTPQVSGLTPSAAWDVLEQHSAESGNAVLYAFQTLAGIDHAIVYPVGLVSDALYDVESLDGQIVGHATGEDLMVLGIGFSRAPESGAQVVLLRRVGEAPGASGVK